MTNKRGSKKTALSFLLVSLLMTSTVAVQAAPGSRAWPTGEGDNTNAANEDTLPAADMPNAPAMGNTNTAGNNVGFTTDPCPEPKKALGSTPDDLAKIQEDITRFTLCVQRAQLLERLNELAEANIETIDTALNLVAAPDEAPMQVQQGNNIMDDIPMPSLPDEISNMLQDDEANAPAPQQETRRARPLRSNWRIRDIQGTGGEIYARLMDDQGTIVKVMQGDDLPDNGGRVSTISNSMVSVTRDGDSTSLRWVD